MKPVSRLELCELLRAGSTIQSVSVGATLEYHGGKFTHALWEVSGHVSWRDVLILLKCCDWE